MIDLWHLTDIDWLGGISAEHAEQLRRTARLQAFAAGERVFGPAPAPDDVYVLETGLIRTYRESREAEEVTFGFVRAGEIFGESVLFKNQPRQSQAMAVEPSTVLVLNRDKFKEIMRQNPRICCSLVRQIEGRFRDIETRVEDLVFRNARNRLARVLLQLARQFGRAENGQIVLPVQLTQKDLAALIGTSRPTVSLALKELEKSALIGRRGRHICIADTARLEKELDQL
jgi:CRP-like cAMP-binding protein